MENLLNLRNFRIESSKVRILRAAVITLGLVLAAFIVDLKEDFNGWYMNPMVFCYVMCFIGLSFKPEVHGIFRLLLTLFVVFLCVRLTYLELEMWQGNNLAEPFDGVEMMKYRLWINWGIILMLFLLFVSVLGGIRLGLTVATVSLGILGFISYIILEFRGETFLPTDIYAVGTAYSVAESYNVELHSNVYSALLMLITMLIWIDLIPKGERSDSWLQFGSRLLARLGGVLVVMLSLWFFWANPVDRFYYPWFVPNNGYLYSFLLNVKLLDITPTGAYSPEELEKAILASKDERILDGEYDPKEAIAEAFPDYEGDKPNIICVMNESFSDLTQVGPFQTDKEMFANINALKPETIQGKAVVEVFGGGTSDSEFSFLTGLSTKLFADNARAYELYIKDNASALPKNLRAQGYRTVAFHPDVAANWNRDKVYPRIGFSEFYDKPAFEGSEIIRDSYASDRATYQKIEELYESKGDQPLFAFDVTLQNHGSYTQSYNNLEPVTILGDYGKEIPRANQFVSLVRESDKAFGELINYFREVDEPTLILMFGDHYPKLENAFYNGIANADKDTWSLAQQRNQHETPFIIWANYELPEANIEEISLNYLSTLVTELTGTERTAFNGYLAGLYKQFPVIDRMGVKTAQGEDLYLDDLNPEQRLQILTYDDIIYNNLLDKNTKLSALYDIN